MIPNMYYLYSNKINNALENLFLEILFEEWRRTFRIGTDWDRDYVICYILGEIYRQVPFNRTIGGTSE